MIQSALVLRVCILPVGRNLILAGSSIDCCMEVNMCHVAACVLVTEVLNGRVFTQVTHTHTHTLGLCVPGVCHLQVVQLALFGDCPLVSC